MSHSTRAFSATPRASNAPAESSLALRLKTSTLVFAAFAKEHYPVKRISQSQLTLNRSMLPKATEIYVLAYPRSLGD